MNLGESAPLDGAPLRSNPQPEDSLVQPSGGAPLTDLEAAVAVTEKAAELVSVHAKGQIDDLPWQEAAALLKQLRSATFTLNAIDASLTRHIYLTAKHGTIEVDGLGVMDVHRSTSRKHWADRTGVHDYVSRKIEETGGELPDPSAVVDWVLEVAGINYLRVTALRSVKLDTEDYCVSEPGKPTVKFL